MKILAIGDPHGSKEIEKIHTKNVDLILITGDFGKADLARKRFFENIERKKEGLPELKYDKKFQKLVNKEIYNSSIYVLEYFSKFAPTYSILGNVGIGMMYKKYIKRNEKKFGFKYDLREKMNKIENFNYVKNNLRNVHGLRIGFLEWFTDANWVQDFKPADYKKQMKIANRETEHAKKILKNFGNNLDILVCHQPPYKILDKVSGKYGAPKHFIGKHAGSKTILNYIKKYQPKYVFCGHIHEGEGKAKIGKTEIYNLGVCGYKIINL